MPCALLDLADLFYMAILIAIAIYLRYRHCLRRRRRLAIGTASAAASATALVLDSVSGHHCLHCLTITTALVAAFAISLTTA